MSQNVLEEDKNQLNKSNSSADNPYDDDREMIKSDTNPENNDNDSDGPVLSEVNPSTNSEQFYDITDSRQRKNSSGMKKSNFKEYSEFHDIPLSQSIRVASSEVGDNHENLDDMEEVKLDGPTSQIKHEDLYDSIKIKEENKSSKEENLIPEQQNNHHAPNLLELFEVTYRKADQGTSTDPHTDVQPTLKLGVEAGIFYQNESMVSDISKKDAEHYLYGHFDEDTLFPTKSDDKKVNKTIETQTPDFELMTTAKESVLHKVKNFEITIPETKLVREGMLYSYISYKLVSKLQDNETVEIAVYRRYSDFYWLYEELATKYLGYIVPMPPPKNVLTTLNKESSEFSETRRRELIIFMEKITNDEFLRCTEEVNSFLFDDSKFNEQKQQSEMLRNAKDQGIVKKFSKLLNSATKRPTGIKEMNENEKEIYNQEVFITINLTKMQDFLTHFSKYVVSKTIQTQETLAILSGFDCLFYYDTPTASQHRIKEMAIIEDGTITEYHHSIETLIKDIIQNLEAAKMTVERRRRLVEEYYDTQKQSEEYQLTIKKESLPHSNELERLRKEIEILKRKKKDSTLILLEKLREFRTKTENQINKVLKTFNKIQSSYYAQLLNIWTIKKSVPDEKR